MFKVHFLAGKIIQIVTNFKNGHTGQVPELSFIIKKDLNYAFFYPALCHHSLSTCARRHCQDLHLHSGWTWNHLMDVEKGNLGRNLLILGAISDNLEAPHIKIQETGDQIVILTYVCSSAVNCIIALQVLYNHPSCIWEPQFLTGVGVLELGCKEEDCLNGCGSDQCNAQSIAFSFRQEHKF